MDAPNEEITAAYRSACDALPKKADFHLIYGTYAWDHGYIRTARQAYAEGIRLHEDYYREGDFSGILAPVSYLRLGEAAELSGESAAAMEFFIRALRLNRRFMPALVKLCRLLAQARAEAADVIAALRGIYNTKKDAQFLSEALINSSFPHAALYYEKRSTAKFSTRTRLLLAGDTCAAAASLIEDTERITALAIAYAPEFTPRMQAELATLIPRSCREPSVTPEALRMQRRIARLGAKVKDIPHRY